MEYQFNEAQEKWLVALESGEYRQAHGEMYDHRTQSYCCLAVACAVAAHPRDSQERYINSDGIAPLVVANSLRLRTRHGDLLKPSLLGGKEALSLVQANDCGATFSEIAAFIRSNPTAVFTE